MPKESFPFENSGAQKTLMKPVGRFTRFGGWALFLGLALAATSAQAAVNKATVRAVRGTAEYAGARGEGWKPLKVGVSLKPNSIVKTAPDSTVDLFLGDNGPVVRVTSDTELGIDKLNYENSGEEKIIETQLDLRNGRILGNVKKMAATSRYEVKTPLGVAGIRGTEYDISANGTVHVISGTVVVVYIVPNGPPVTLTVNAGETALPPGLNNGTAAVVPTPGDYRWENLPTFGNEIGQTTVPINGRVETLGVVVIPVNQRTLTEQQETSRTE
jgi:hypothetical protein